jgi:hypothetical protein
MVLFLNVIIQVLLRLWIALLIIGGARQTKTAWELVPKQQLWLLAILNVVFTNVMRSREEVVGTQIHAHFRQ